MTILVFWSVICVMIGDAARGRRWETGTSGAARCRGGLCQRTRTQALEDEVEGDARAVREGSFACVSRGQNEARDVQILENAGDFVDFELLAKEALPDTDTENLRHVGAPERLQLPVASGPIRQNFARFTAEKVTDETIGGEVFLGFGIQEEEKLVGRNPRVDHLGAGSLPCANLTMHDLVEQLFFRLCREIDRALADTCFLGDFVDGSLPKPETSEHLRRFDEDAFTFGEGEGGHRLTTLVF